MDKTSQPARGRDVPGASSPPIGKIHNQGVISAVVTRADGTVVNLGVISAQYSSPMKNVWWQLFGRKIAHLRIQSFNRSNRRGTNL